VRQGGPVTTETAESPWRTTRERGPQRDAKRDAVVRAAAKLFTTRGFKGTSLDDIAASLGVTKPTLYHYVANKEEILFACVQRGLDALRAGIDETRQSGVDGRERLRAVLRHFAAIVTSDFGLCVIRVGEDYYLAGTTMHMNPAVQIMHSKDLVNWELAGYCMDRLDLGPAFRMEGGRTIYGQGIWAPCIRYHQGTFHIFSNVNGAGLQVFRSTSIKGPLPLVEIAPPYSSIK